MTKRIRIEAKYPEMVKSIVNTFEETLDMVLSSLVERGDNLNKFNEALDVAILVDAVGEKDELTVQYMQLALKLGTARFISGLELPEKFNLVYLGKTYPYIVEKKRDYIDPESWLKVTYLAIILRDADALGIMCRIPTDALRGGNSISPESSFYLVNFMKGLFDRTADIGELLITAMKSTEDTDYMFDIRVPLLGLYGSYFSDDQNEFNESLQEALRLHKTFWTDNPDNTYDYNGWISMELLAALSIAYDNKDWVQQMESDYIPYWLANGALV